MRWHWFKIYIPTFYFSIQKDRGDRGDLGRGLGGRRSHLILWLIHFGVGVHAGKQQNKQNSWLNWRVRCEHDLTFSGVLVSQKSQDAPSLNAAPRAKGAALDPGYGDYLWYSGKRGNYSRRSGDIRRSFWNVDNATVFKVLHGGLWWL